MMMIQPFFEALPQFSDKPTHIFNMNCVTVWTVWRTPWPAFGEQKKADDFPTGRRGAQFVCSCLGAQTEWTSWKRFDAQKIDELLRTDVWNSPRRGVVVSTPDLVRQMRRKIGLGKLWTAEDENRAWYAREDQNKVKTCGQTKDNYISASLLVSTSTI